MERMTFCAGSGDGVKRNRGEAEVVFELVADSAEVMMGGGWLEGSKRYFHAVKGKECCGC